jgi:hypothetical protein
MNIRQLAPKRAATLVARLRFLPALLALALVATIVTLATPAKPATASACVPRYTYLAAAELRQVSDCGAVDAPLVGLPEGTFSARLSPNGTTAASIHDRIAKQIVLTPVDGSPAQVLSIDVGYVTSLDWLPDSRTIVYAYADLDGHTGMYLVPVDGSPSRQLIGTLTGDRYSDLQVGPDGTKVLYQVANYGGTESAVRYASLATGAVTTVRTVQSPSQVTGVAWTPDGNHAVYGLSPENQVRATALAGGAEITLPAPSGLMPSVARDWTLAIMYQSSIATMTLNNASDLRLQEATVPPYTEGTRPDFRDEGTVTAPPLGWPPGSTTPPPSNCPPLHFVGVRGSGEREFEGYGLGKTVMALRDELKRYVPGMTYDAVEYPAVAVGYAAQEYGTAYVNSIIAGKTELETVLMLFWNKCKDTRVVLAGYSQGAHVAGDTYYNLLAADRKKIAAIMLFGDPRFGHQNGVTVRKAGYSAKLFGVWNVPYHDPRQFKPEDAPYAHSYCMKGDPVCNFTVTAATLCSLPGSKCPHVLYVENGWPREAARWAATHLRPSP